MKIRIAIPLLAASLAVALTGCVNADTEASTGTDLSGITVDATAAALLPTEVAESGVLRLGTDAAYPPNEFKSADGQPVGWVVELAEAIAAKLDLTPEWEILGFDSILPRIEESALDVGSASFTDTVERQKTVDFVNFLNAGTLWAAAADTDIDPENACGLPIAVQTGTIQHTDELPALSAACEASGNEAIEILPFDNQPAVTNAVINGQAVAFSADSPVTGAAVAALEGELVVVGELSGAAPYGFATQKGSNTTLAVQAALQSLMDDGTYQEILSAAGITEGALPKATINAATD